MAFWRFRSRSDLYNEQGGAIDPPGLEQDLKECSKASDPSLGLGGFKRDVVYKHIVFVTGSGNIHP